MQVVAATDVLDDYLESTDHIAYQHSNLIQPHVLFLNVDRHTRAILNVSTNVEAWLGLGPTQVVGRTLNGDLLAGIDDVLQGLKSDSRSIQIFSQRVQRHDGQPLLCRIVNLPTRWMLELELEHHPGDVSANTLHLEQLLIERVQSLTCDLSVDDIVTTTTRQMRELLGYERGMCYRFDEENNGEVIAESTAVAGEEKYLHLRFPARDVPRTAREMLVASPIRTTLDQDIECHQIYPSRDPHTLEYVDLTHIRGRGAAGACREYYRNINVRSTYVLPLVVENRLWGLLAFHDQQVRRVSPKLDDHLQSIAKCVSMALKRNLRTLREQVSLQGSEVVKALSEVDSTSTQWLRYIQSHTNDLKELIPCSGFILRLAGEILTAGIVPEAADKLSFTDRLWDLSRGKPLRSNRLQLLDEDLGSFRQVAAGAIAVPLSDDHNDVAIWLRQEQRHTVRWAGDPLGSILTDDSGRKRLCPRESFEVWTRVTENTCLPWTEQELSLATSASMQLGLLTLSWYAAQASQAKSQFLSCMSHELRTPMTAILGYANLLKERCSSANSDTTGPVCEYIDVIERNGQYLLSLIDDILNLAKIEAGKLTVERIPIAVSDLLTDVVALIKVQADLKQLKFVHGLTSPVPRIIQSDPVRLRQILLNLLGNAFKFTPHGQVMLQVGYQSTTQQMTFDVIDTGIGMTEPQISRLFKAFTQADESTTRRFGGTGLGLQISKNLAQLLGGDITVSSEAGVGSKFSVTIDSGCTEPIDWIDQLPENGRPSQSNSPAARPVMPSLKGLRIMLLEDGVDNQRLLRHLLSKAEADVTIFENGKLGIESVTTDGLLESPLRSPFPFDMVLTDMQMPELDGYDTARLLRQKGCAHPIIALTAFAMDGNDEACFRAGCDDYLSKPIDRAALINMCDKWRRPREPQETSRTQIGVTAGDLAELQRG